MSLPPRPERLDVRPDLVRRLVAEQFPQWAHLPVDPVDRPGWDNRTFRLGPAMTVRMPSAAGYAEAVAKEQRWLPVLAPQLPLPVPVPLGHGVPDRDYPFPWSVYGWLDGRTAFEEAPADPVRFAADVARFLVALGRVDPAGGPQPGQHNWFRGGPLTTYDAQTRQALRDLAGRVDVAAARSVWEEALAASWDGVDRWFHGDVAPGNLLLSGGELSAVIDFGTCGVGDPSCDLAIAWTTFTGAARETFRAELGVDDATWARGRGWALWKALITIDESEHVVEEILRTR
ncbi:aminoglycoside phosphotransferase family protein [Kineococcus rhizosphaerae]|uniref:Aminoglycoside phosphotransferase (APT) family kinase protein n=1 Tax=Kineococcus rhizosphaerae TaxID=559628 RepID=A0A2T0QXK9_9ACTN|nr:aminoglycoside phosphotransferase family protein [Kineococcus rhizosphaerae]PRY10753.1 aminoglycoside phosphotransferase (APT) family kinase protein [Kineococcus rhizosphaerae]